MRLPKLMAMIEAGKRKVIAIRYMELCGVTGSVVVLRVCISGTRMIMMGTMNIVINSRRRVNALKSFLINAASIVENPSLPKKPVLGA